MKFFLIVVILSLSRSQFLPHQDQPPAMGLLSQFLLEDNQAVKENGGVIDKTGFEGLPPSEQPAPLNTAQRLLQRARSAVILHKRAHGNNNTEALGGVEDEEKIDNWKIYNIMTMSGSDYSVLKVCLPLSEQMIALVIEKNEYCGPRISNVVQALNANTKPLFSGNFGGLSYPSEVFQTVGAKQPSPSPLDQAQIEAKQLKGLFVRLAQEAQTSLGRIEEAMKAASDRR